MHKIVVYRWILQIFFCETDDCWVMSWNSLKDEPKASPVKFLRVTQHLSRKKNCKIQCVIYFIHVQSQRFDHKAKNTVFFHMYVDKIFLCTQCIKKNFLHCKNFSILFDKAKFYTPFMNFTFVQFFCTSMCFYALILH